MEDALRHGHIIALSALLVFSTSCSWYRNLERSLVDDDDKKNRSRSVPGEQYDQLLVKYEELSKKYEELKENPNSGKSSLVDELQNSKSENFAAGLNSQSETVDIFSTELAPASPGASSVEKDIEGQLSLYRRGLALKANNPSEATKIFQQLENQGIPSVKVRAKLQIGELLLGKGQYDLALQVFEDIINKEAHSGLVLDALKYAIMCSGKLGAKNKRDQYSSMLNDVFESN
jgi:hypothetical protein